MARMTLAANPCCLQGHHHWEETSVTNAADDKFTYYSSQTVIEGRSEARLKLLGKVKTGSYKGDKGECLGPAIRDKQHRIL